MRIHWRVGGIAAFLLVSAAVPGEAADPYGSARAGSNSGLPAVSAPNGKVEISGGTSSDGGILTGIGSFALPLGHSGGFQIDGGVGTVGGAAVSAVGGHLFWRSPALGLLGIYADYTYFSATSLAYTRVAIEGELYLDRVTLRGLLGTESGPGVTDHGFGKLSLAYYPTNDFKLYGGFNYLPNRGGTTGLLGLEVMPAGFGASGVALFAEGRASELSSTALIGGVRVYFGPKKSLIRRHREDDPETDFDFDPLPSITGVVKGCLNPCDAQ